MDGSSGLPSSSSLSVQLCASVLHIRGSSMVKQPLVCRGQGYHDGDCDDGILCYNGEIYDSYNDNEEGGESCSSCNEEECEEECEEEVDRNDTLLLLKWITKYGIEQACLKAKGEWTFIYKKGDQLWFAKDFLGRRSLTIGRYVYVYVTDKVLNTYTHTHIHTYIHVHTLTLTLTHTLLALPLRLPAPSPPRLPSCP